MTRQRLRWLTAFLDFRADSFDEGVRFWAAVTGSDPKEPTGDHGEYVMLEPPDGEPYLGTQRVGDAGGIHLDLHVDDVQQAAADAEGLGARVTTDHGDFVVLSSPGGFAFCFVVSHGEGPRPAPASWPSGRSLVDQVCLDIPPAGYDVETDFWAELIGWERLRKPGSEFQRLVRPEPFALRVLLQRLDDPAERVSAHLDLAADDRQAEVDRHLSLGAREPEVYPGWTRLRDPLGKIYCVTGRTVQHSLDSGT